MPIYTQSDLIEKLEAGDFDAVLDTPESSWLDFKKKAYEGTPTALSRKGRYELCKDAAALANRGGGVLLLGVSEKLSEINGLSIADKITPVKVISLSLAHYKSILMNHVYPLLAVETNWYQHSEGKGLLAIVVAERKNGFHIVKDTVEENGKGLHGLNIPLREGGDQTYFYTAEALYELIYQKQQTDTKNTFSDQGNKYAAMPQIMEEQNNKVHASGKTIRDNLISSLDYDELPVMIIQAVAVTGPYRLEGFFDKVADEFRDIKPVRSIGFNLNSFGYEASTTDGAFVKSGVRDIALRLDSDGTTTMVMRGNEAFLGRGVNKDGLSIDGKIRINSIVLVEVIFEFVRFIHKTLAKYGLTNWQYTIDVRRFKEHKICLNPGGPNSLFGDELNAASRDDWVRTLGKHADYTIDAYTILTEIYALFMLPDTAIPFATHNPGAVTEQTILSINENINGY